VSWGVLGAAMAAIVGGSQAYEHDGSSAAAAFAVAVILVLFIWLGVRRPKGAAVRPPGPGP